MSARHPVPAIPASQARTDAGPYLNPFHDYHLDLDRRAADLEAQIARFQDAEREEQLNDARIEAEYQAMLDAEADALAEGIASGDLDEFGEPVPYDRYYGGVR